jgi:hypothetical protein
MLQGTAAVTAGMALPAVVADRAVAELADSAPIEAVPLHWLDGVPTTTTGSVFGVPWPRGAVRSASFALTTSGGDSTPVQSWPLATWPDGSLKWTGHAVAADAGLDKQLSLAPGSPSAPSTVVSVKRRRDSIVLDNGTVAVTVATSGQVVLRSVTRGNRVTARDGRLVLRLQDRPEDPDRQTTWTGVIESAVIEQHGPVRAVVKLSGRYLVDGHHKRGQRRLLPWTMRVCLSAGAESLRLVHSFVWDGNASTDFIRGLGLEIRVPMSDPLYNRHVRFAGADRGVWGEPVVVLTGLRRDPGPAVNEAQVAGTAAPPPDQWANSTVSSEYQDLPRWNDFTLVQHASNAFAIWKRTSGRASWLKHAGFGDRAPGFGYVGGSSGGIGFGLRDFWQMFPRALDVRDAAADTATVTLWSWSPHGEAMDLRAYDTVPHGLDLAYEDPRDGFGVSTGIARSTEIELWAFDATPSRDRVADLASLLGDRPQLLTTPATYHRSGVFGRWGLPNRNTPGTSRYEDDLEATTAFYAKQVDQRGWYGFWNYGDVMHTYDADRHVWRYDVGGYAWDNAELGTDAMLWYAFLRSGSATTFRLAQAMTRHVSEVDTYHAGPFTGLGSRHNVQHWCDGAKEGRVAESYTKRFAYYLTADELLGDILEVGLGADRTLVAYPPLRGYLDPPPGVPTVIRIGPDWYALVSNWLTKWERSGDSRYRDLIVTGMRDIAGLPAGLFTGQQGGAVGFDPVTGHLSNLNLGGDFKGGYNLAMAFCGEQILWETLDLIDVPEFRQTLLEFARYVQAPAAEQIAHYGFSFNPQVFKTIYSRMTAWAGEQLGEVALQQRGWSEFGTDPAGRPWPAATPVTGTGVLAPVEEIPAGDFTTNDAAQRGLAYIALLAVAPGQAPTG